MIYHITPINDIKDHDDNSSCECNPVIEVLENGDMMCVHNSYDGREGLELANEILK